MSQAQQFLPALPWYDIDDPNSPALDELARKFNLHELQIEDCRHRPQRAKIEEHDHYIFVVLKHLAESRTATFDDCDIFLGKNFLITVHAGSVAFTEKLQQRIRETSVSRLDQLFYSMVDLIVDEYVPVLDVLADEICDVESEVLNRPEPDVLAEILRLKRYLVEYRRIAAAMREVVNAIMRRQNGLLGDDLDPYFRDVYDHLVRSLELAEAQRDLLTGSLDIYLSAVANRTNEVMKVLTIWGTLALPLVVITGFFGMNLVLPWTHNVKGPIYAVALMMVSWVGILIYFRRKNWF
ncbi:MAG: magnesium/cobalt transporter CorA [Candidatus Korobacteraceae bacterium]